MITIKQLEKLTIQQQSEKNSTIISQQLDENSIAIRHSLIQIRQELNKSTKIPQQFDNLITAQQQFDKK